MDKRLVALFSHDSVKDKEFLLTGDYIEKLFISLVNSNQEECIYAWHIGDAPLHSWSDAESNKLLNNIFQGCTFFDVSSRINMCHTFNIKTCEISGYSGGISFNTLKKEFNYYGFTLSIDDIKSKTLKLDRKEIDVLSDPDNLKAREALISFVKNNWDIVITVVNNVDINGKCISSDDIDEYLKNSINTEWLFSYGTHSKDSSNDDVFSKLKYEVGNITLELSFKEGSKISTEEYGKAVELLASLVNK